MAELNFVDADPEKVQNRLIANFERLADRKLQPADPVRLFLLAAASEITQMRADMNIAARQNLLRYARGEVLDYMGDAVNTPRIGAVAAQVPIRFTLSTVQRVPITIPAGTRISPRAGLYFAPKTNVIVPPGLTEVDAVCECLTAGEVGNGWLTGQINTIVDPVQWLATAVNTAKSAGGAEKESDDQYRARIRAAPESFSVAGPKGSYEHWVRAVSPDIIDVLVQNAAPGKVSVVALMKGGIAPSEEIKTAIRTKLNDTKIRPLSDEVIVESPVEIKYDIRVDYWIDEEHADNLESIKKAVNASVEEYVVWQKSKLGRDLNPDELIKRMLQAGAKRTKLTSPTFTKIPPNSFASAYWKIYNYAGVEDA